MFEIIPITAPEVSLPLGQVLPCGVSAQLLAVVSRREAAVEEESKALWPAGTGIPIPEVLDQFVSKVRINTRRLRALSALREFKVNQVRVPVIRANG